jgi:hypothetical protein
MNFLSSEGPAVILLEYYNSDFSDNTLFYNLGLWPKFTHL